ncbi:probable Kinesin-3 motor protein [Melanopsichium pennsylvanicum]|uniref:Kinesin-3 motor protein n=2 Tax=Melanopsichium pennsylvanicum TaxID=63383 RepID=A0A077R2N5_9BASI|nr:Kinesin-3 motor protein [Melanopsichium pennsylvanicum 4]SNX88021.1 probable Kinesin-3 motor protein [Melanopsichium pennsylvanicum]
MADSGNIKVVVRCRPMNSRERNRGASNLIEFVDDRQLVLQPPSDTDTRESSKATKKKSMPFSFDRAYDENTEQHTLFQYIGLELLQHAFNGFNTCVFAYGQTGSGKSHSMVGYAEAKGLIPLTCSRLFDDIRDKTVADDTLKISVEVSYIEIYNEKVRDLLNPKNKGNLKVREHPSLGPYVEDLSKLVVGSFSDIENLMDEGNKARTVAATNMNETSSRSHAVFTLVLTQKRFDVQTKLEAEKVSRISLVDLAGSERANSTGATGARLKEGANINRSLTTLGKVIAALAIASGAPEPTKGAKKKTASLDSFVPYRDSVLTWLLKDSLGGNSKTAMIAAISPADYEETLSTLRYADQAKKIKNKAVVNEDPNAKLIRELKEELEMLRTRVSGGGGIEGESSWDPNIPPEKQVVRYQTKSGEIKTVTKAALQEQLEQSEKIMSSLNESWEEKLQKTQQIQKEREKALEELGISVDKGNVGVHTPKKLPHLVNLNEDPLMSECLIYQIKPGQTMVGNLESGADVHIKLSGTNILAKHCMFDHQDGVVTVTAMGESMTMVNGKRLAPHEPKRLRSGYRVILGDFHVFRFNHPEEVRKARDRVRSTLALSTGEGHNETLVEGDLPSTRPDSPASGDVDWTYARREYAMAKLNGQNVNFENLNEEDLEKLFEDISRARSKKSMGGLLGRPESRASLFDDNASESASSVVRPYSYGAMTDDTSIDPWSQAGSEMGSMRFGAGTPMKENPYSNVAASPAVQRETESLRAKVKEYEEKLVRMASSPRLDDGPVEYTDTQQELLRKALAKWRSHTKVSMAEDALSKAVLVKEANVISKELDKRVTYQFTVVDDFPLAIPTSGVEAIAGLTEFDHVSDPDLANCAKPCMGIKVLDYVHSTCYVWSMPKFEARLQKMRNLYTFVDKPEYSQHFNWSDPFYEAPHPTYAFVASTMVPLNPLSRQLSAKYRLPLMDRHTGAEIGSCSVGLKFVSINPVPIGRAGGSLSAPNGSSHPSSRGPSSPTPSSINSQTTGDLPVGQKLGFQILVDSLSGISLDNFSSIHLQVKLSSFAGNALGKDEIYTSVPNDLASEECISELRLRRTLSFVLTEESIAWLRNGYAPVELYAKVKPDYLVGLEAYDDQREAEERGQVLGRREDFMPLHAVNGVGFSVKGKTATLGKTMKERLSENEMRGEEKHHVLASVQICELDASGEYLPVPVRASSALDPGSFFLRQGLQRKVIITLSHDSGRQFPWSRVTKVWLGDVRLLDARGRVHGGKDSDTVVLKTPPKQQEVEFNHNGTSTLSVWAWWDSSVHDSLHLNRTTPSNHRVLMRLCVSVQVDKVATPVELSMDMAVSINARDAKPPGRLMSFIESATSGGRMLSKTTAVFGVKLTPPMMKRSKDLWRLNTGERYVRGQEALRGWKVRGVSVVRDFEELKRREERRVAVEGVKTLLKVRPPLALSVGSGGEDGEERSKEELLEKTLGWWKKAVRESKMLVHIADQPSVNDNVAVNGASRSNGLKDMFTETATSPGIGVEDFSLTTTPPKLDRTLSSTSSSLSNAVEPPKLTAQVSLIPRTDTATHKGYLLMPTETLTDSWTKRYFILRRPFLHVYESSSELQEIMVIHVGSTVRVEHDENLQRLLDRHCVFGLYTSNNSYMLQAKDQADLQGWLAALDSLYAQNGDE